LRCSVAVNYLPEREAQAGDVGEIDFAALKKKARGARLQKRNV
jgi:hypothetical protein